MATCRTGWEGRGRGWATVGRGEEAYVRMWSRKGNEGEDESDFQNEEPQRLEDDDKV